MFSPLALTQVLPFLPLAQGDIHYQVEEREDPHLIERVLQEKNTRVIMTRNGLLGVPFRHHTVVYQSSTRMRLATLPGTYVAQALEQRPNVIAIYLGSYNNNEHVVALDVSAMTGTQHKRAVDESATSVDESFDEHASARKNGTLSLLASAIERLDWVDLREFVPHASAREIGQATTMLSLANWYAYQQHCPHCGFPTQPAMSGWAQRCTNAEDDHRMLFPRIEPAIIMTVVDAQDRLLLQHNQAWADPNFYSVSAGFVEAGENLEHACRRETQEETGIRIGEVKYLGSQPWPFPLSLMTAFKGQALSTEIHVDGQEVSKAQWVTREELTDLLIDQRINLPGKATIARYMIEEWYGHPL